jgi:TRAP-type mannitol/chloroaromatic compound transport system permease small subunit
VNDSHIRVDLIYARLPRRTRHGVELAGLLLLLLPLLWVLLDHSLAWAAAAYAVGESSQNPTGLPFRWLIKGALPAAIILLWMAALARLLREAAGLLQGDPPAPPGPAPARSEPARSEP